MPKRSLLGKEMTSHRASGIAAISRGSKRFRVRFFHPAEIGVEAKGVVSAGSGEGRNYNAKLTMRKAYGFRTLHGVKIALYHRLGALPEPQFAHEFC